MVPALQADHRSSLLMAGVPAGIIALLAIRFQISVKAVQEFPCMILASDSRPHMEQSIYHIRQGDSSDFRVICNNLWLLIPKRLVRI